MQQMTSEDLGQDLVAETFTRRVVVGLNELGEAGVGKRGEVGLAGMVPTPPE